MFTKVQNLQITEITSMINKFSPTIILQIICIATELNNMVPVVEAKKLFQIDISGTYKIKIKNTQKKPWLIQIFILSASTVSCIYGLFIDFEMFNQKKQLKIVIRSV